MTVLTSMTEAARLAGTFLMEQRARLADITIEEKGRHDFVTEIDRASEERIISYLDARHPGLGVLAEESEQRLSTGSDRWVIDPLDGTTNYLHGYPCYSVSIALQSGADIVAGVVLDPVRDQLYAAEKGRGATLSGAPLTVSSASELSRALLVTGFPFKVPDRLDEYLAAFRLLLQRSSGLRRDGSAALDLCHVAAGRCDGFFELGLAPWDVAAGGLIALEAGARITDGDGGNGWLEDQSIVAAAPGVHGAILQTLADARQGHPA